VQIKAPTRVNLIGGEELAMAIVKGRTSANTQVCKQCVITNEDECIQVVSVIGEHISQNINCNQKWKETESIAKGVVQQKIMKEIQVNRQSEWLGHK